ncbi:MAG: glycogen/starch/alpha-glucan phosphorylase [Gallionella sp.]
MRVSVMGGLGRLAACFLDSCATMQLPVMGCGIRYEYGMIRQRIEDGNQIEEPDHWLRDGNPWELERPEVTRRVRYGGRTERYGGHSGELLVRWAGTHSVLAVPHHEHSQYRGQRQVFKRPYYPGI